MRCAMQYAAAPLCSMQQPHSARLNAECHTAHSACRGAVLHASNMCKMLRSQLYLGQDSSSEHDGLLSRAGVQAVHTGALRAIPALCLAAALPRLPHATGRGLHSLGTQSTSPWLLQARVSACCLPGCSNAAGPCVRPCARPYVGLSGSREHVTGCCQAGLCTAVLGSVGVLLLLWMGVALVVWVVGEGMARQG